MVLASWSCPRWRVARRHGSSSGRAAARFDWDRAREARGAARALVRRGGGTVLPYRCRFCDGWHVGHPMAAALGSPLMPEGLNLCPRGSRPAIRGAGECLRQVRIVV